MQLIPTRLSTATLIEACHSNLMEKSLSFARLPGGEIHGDNPRWFTTPSKLAGYNGIVQAAFPPEGADTCIEIAIEPFCTRKQPFTWWTGPYSGPANLGTLLQAHGFVHNRDMIGMACLIDDLRPTRDNLPEIEVESVINTEMLADWHALNQKGFNTPAATSRQSLEMMEQAAFGADLGWQHFMVHQNGRLVAISSLFVNDEIAGLYNLVTEPEVRGNGLGAALTLQTFAAARDMGCRIATLQTTYPNALRLYHRLGFEVYCKFGIYQYLKF